MIVKLIEDKLKWENFVESQGNTLFVQSYNYGKFYESMGESSWIFGIFDDNGGLMGGSLVVSTHAKRGNFLYLPFGPILPETNKNKALFVFINHLKEFAQSKNEYHFIRVSPFMEDTEENRQAFKNNGFQNAPMHVLAETTWMLDLSPTEEELMMEMNKNHRNLIRRCIREGVGVEKTGSQESLEKFYKIYSQTAKRHKFYKFPKEYINKEFDIFSKNNQALSFSSNLPSGELDSSAIIIYYGSMAVYRHGASLGGDKKLPTSYLLQWEAILEAKRRGMRYYNFWGIAPEKSKKNHPFAGITHFKKGFGGFQKNLIHCQDLYLSPKYYINWCIETVRRLKRGF